MAELIPYLIGAAVLLISHKLGIKVPGLPEPPVKPVAPADPAVDKEASEFLAWALKVKTGVLRLDEQDRETLKLIQVTLKEIA